MQLIEVESSMIYAVGYDEPTLCLGCVGAERPAQEITVAPATPGRPAPEATATPAASVPLPPATRPPSGPLLQPADLVYLGAFRLPGDDTPPETLA